MESSASSSPLFSTFAPAVLNAPSWCSLQIPHVTTYPVEALNIIWSLHHLAQMIWQHSNLSQRRHKETTRGKNVNKMLKEIHFFCCAHVRCFSYHGFILIHWDSSRFKWYVHSFTSSELQAYRATWHRPRCGSSTNEPLTTEQYNSETKHSAGLHVRLEGIAPVSVLGLYLCLCSRATHICFVWIVSSPPPT